MQRMLVGLVSSKGGKNKLNSLLEDARSLYMHAVAKYQDSDGAKWVLDILLATIEFEVADQKLLNGILQVGLMQTLGISMPLPQRIETANQIIAMTESALTRLQGVCNASAEKEQWEIHAHALLTCADGRFKTFNLLAMNELTNKADDPERTRKMLEVTHSQAEQGHEIFKKLGLRHWAFRAARLRADILNSLERPTERDELLGHLRSEVEVLGLDPSNARLQSDVAKERVKRQLPEREFPGFASLREEDIHTFADFVQETLDLPEERRVNIETDIRATQYVAQEKIKWCKHIDMKQDLRHTKNLKTLYAKNPGRVAFCHKFGYESKIENPHIATVIRAFKMAVCNNCKGREL